jgi:hypothetical protein
MRYTIVTMTMLFSSLFAEYEVFVTKSVPYERSVAEEEIFFGTWEAYSDAQTELLRSIAEHGTMGAIDGVSAGAGSLARGFVGEGMSAAGAGVAIGLVIGLLDPFVMGLYADQQYIAVRNVTLPDGRLVRKAVIFVGDKHPALDETQIHAILKKR